MSHGFQSPTGASLNFDLPFFPSPGFSAGLAKVPSAFDTDGSETNFVDISSLDVFADEDYDTIPNTNHQSFNLPDIFDANNVCTILRQKITQPPPSWTQRTSDGLILLLHNESNQSNIPSQISLQIAIEIVSSLLLHQLQELTPPNLGEPAQLLPQQIDAGSPNLERLEIYASGMELLKSLHSLGSVRDTLLPHLPLVRFNIQQLSMRVIVCLNFKFKFVTCKIGACKLLIKSLILTRFHVISD
jgi:hypothetical protein